MKTTHKPGDLLKMLRGGGSGARMAMKSAGMKHHGKKSTKKKVAAPDKQNLGLALKKSHQKAATHIHVHFHSGKPQGTGLEHREESKHEFKRAKKMKKAHKNASHGTKVEDPKEQGEKQERTEVGKKEFKKSHKCKGSACKHASHKKKAPRA